MTKNNNKYLGGTKNVLIKHLSRKSYDIILIPNNFYKTDNYKKIPEE